MATRGGQPVPLQRSCATAREPAGALAPPDAPGAHANSSPVPSRVDPAGRQLGLPNHFTFPTGWGKIGEGSFGEVYKCWFRPLAPSGPAPAGIASAQQAGRAAAAAASSPAGPASVSSGGGGIIGDEAAEWVAVKLFPRLGQLVPEQLEYLRREVVCMMRLEHPHVVAFKEVGLTPDGRLYLAMEYADSGNMRQWLDARGGKLEEPLARWFLQQLVYGIDYCHAHGVFNRDIKPANLLLHAAGPAPEQPLLKVADFGLCKSTNDSAPHSRVGSPFYMAPEVFLAAPYDGRKADVFSCGVVLHEMVTGRLPFAHKMGNNPRVNFRALREFYSNIHTELQESLAMAGYATTAPAAAPLCTPAATPAGPAGPPVVTTGGPVAAAAAAATPPAAAAPTSPLAPPRSAPAATTAPPAHAADAAAAAPTAGPHAPTAAAPPPGRSLLPCWHFHFPRIHITTGGGGGGDPARLTVTTITTPPAAASPPGPHPAAPNPQPPPSTQPLPLPPQQPPPTSSPLLSLLRGMLCFDPAARLTMYDIKRHLWYRQGCSSALYGALLADPRVSIPRGPYRPWQSVDVVEGQFRVAIRRCRELQEDALHRAEREQFEY